MKKSVLLCIVILFWGCRSVDDWNQEPVLLEATVIQAGEYVQEQEKYLNLIRTRNDLSIIDNLTIEQLDESLLIEKEIAIASQRLANSWFDFYLQLRQDPGFKKAVSGHYYFRKGIQALDHSEKMKQKKGDSSLKESKLYNDIILLEGECRLAIGQIAAYNTTMLNTERIFSDLKKMYKIMD